MSYGKDGQKIPHDKALFLTILVISSMVVASATWIYLNPRPVEPFFALGILGEDMMAEHYYPGDNSSIKLGDSVKWHITLYNHMGSAQYVSIRAKLLNATTPPPDDINHTASSVPYFEEIRRVLSDNETWTFPFYWSVENITENSDTVQIMALKLNNVTIYQNLDTTALHGYNFRIVFELWSYTNQTTGFQFGWRSGSEMRSAWVQIWFNLTLPTQQREEANVVNPVYFPLTLSKTFEDGLGMQLWQISASDIWLKSFTYIDFTQLHCVYPNCRVKRQS